MGYAGPVFGLFFRVASVTRVGYAGPVFGESLGLPGVAWVCLRCLGLPGAVCCWLGLPGAALGCSGVPGLLGPWAAWGCLRLPGASGTAWAAWGFWGCLGCLGLSGAAWVCLRSVFRTAIITSMDYAGPVFGLCFRAALPAQRVTLGRFLCCFSHCQRNLRGLRWAGVWAVFPRGQRHPSRLRWAGLWAGFASCQRLVVFH